MALNAISIKDAHLILIVVELLDELSGAKYFSKLDLRLGYRQVLVNLEDKYKLLFGSIMGISNGLLCHLYYQIL